MDRIVKFWKETWIASFHLLLVTLAAVSHMRTVFYTYQSTTYEYHLVNKFIETMQDKKHDKAPHMKN